MPFIGNQPAEKYASFLTETFTVSNTVNYNLSHAVSNENDIRLVINNVVQQPGSGKAYTASGTTLTLSEATQVGDVMYCVYLGRALQTVNPPNNSVGTNQLVDGAVTTAKIVNDAVTETKLSALANPFASQLLHVRDEKAIDSNGGNPTAGINTRDLNTIKTNEITGASVSSNEITLPAGTYYLDASSPAYKATRHHAYLYNTTDSATTITGTAEYNHSSYSVLTRSFIIGRFTISSQKVFTLRHYIQSSNTAGLGLSSYYVSGNTSNYADVKIWRTA